MNSTSRPFSSALYVALFISLVTGTSCDREPRTTQYSHYKVAGTAKLSVFIDSVVADRGTVDNALYMELMTKTDTFLVKPIDQELSFPQLQDSLTQVNLYYQDWYVKLQGQVVRNEYPALYFPHKEAIITIDTYPFEHRQAQVWLKQKKERVYYEIRFAKEGRFFSTSLAQTYVNNY
ncbi:hypothetical protein H9L05_22705 (plasmid) [Hymenobacter qilianensis]|uniref:Uncharacterized protein n=1 Tax=Hymenobacter qilianensis TaxID=1385715 RepID=A0A7H0H1V8_9BACT|nr:hypothetical protein [Hymenobacter qilianensis]QNP54524.1 hypothetical protein H9L05_22705 [Hymenobacter qilianensis]